MKMRRMGNTGVNVSELCLGTMNFGMPEWGIDARASIALIHAFMEAGGNFIDTADVYGGGASEEICAQAIAGQRDQVVIATKGFFPVTPTFHEPPAHANAHGASRRHLTTALEDSLRRLKTDYVDLYQVHCWDRVTPIHETLATMDAFVKSGKVRYVGLSNFKAWQIVEARQLCTRHGWEPFVTAQMQYSLACRDIETDVVEVCQRYNIGVLPWSPLAQGVLTGKYKADLTGPQDARFGDNAKFDDAWRSGFVNKRNLAIAETVKAVAGEHKAAPAAIAIAWLLRQPTIASVIIGPKSTAQLQDNLKGCDVHLTTDQLAKLSAISQPLPTYPAAFIDQMPRNRNS